ncbi:lipoate--protein ligase family protein [Marinobacterium aestuariivivens]|uniref:Biotin/lipoate A/B protein ligase family protein n=1 Tax=Marinobacterium aestuariivivens TaxID=1698799 RepID=A0ABW2A450_9GAMM
MNRQSALHDTVLDPREGLRREMDLLQSVVSGEQPAGFVIWRCRRAIVVPRSLTHKPGFERACEALGQQDWPVIVRETGGDLTPQAPGLLNVALAFRQRRVDGAIRDSYLRLCDPLIDCLRSLGIEAYCASVEGAFCDGDYNLVVDGRKLAGTAQRWRKMAPATGAAQDEFAVLAHAVILVDEDLATLWRMGNAFYRHCGLDAHIDDSLHVQLAELLPGSGDSLLERTQDLFAGCLQAWQTQQ